MNAFIKHLKPEEIEKAPYDGWYWMSHETQPVRLYDEPFNSGLLTLLPFVVEAQLYNRVSDYNISIRHIDGAYQIIRYDLEALKKDDKNKMVIRQLLGHRLAETNEKQPFLRVVDIWTEAADENCEGMTTLVPLCSVFAGFKN